MIQIGIQLDAPALVVALYATGSLTEADVGHRLQRHGAAARCRHRQVLQGGKVAPGTLDQAHPDGNLPIGQGELGAVLRQIPQVAMRMVELMLSTVTPRARRQIQPRPYHQLRLLQVGVDAWIAQHGEPAHFVQDLGRGAIQQRRVVTGQGNKVRSASPPEALFTWK